MKLFIVTEKCEARNRRDRRGPPTINYQRAVIATNEAEAIERAVNAEPMDETASEYLVTRSAAEVPSGIVAAGKDRELFEVGE